MACGTLASTKIKGCQGNPVAPIKALMTNQDQSSSSERRRSDRVKKNFILTYYNKSDPAHKYEITQLKNIGMGGMCFITSKPYALGTILGIDLKTPYLSDTTKLEGRVLESHEKVKNIIYE